MGVACPTTPTLNWELVERICWMNLSVTFIFNWNIRNSVSVSWLHVVVCDSILKFVVICTFIQFPKLEVICCTTSKLDVVSVQVQVKQVKVLPLCLQTENVTWCFEFLTLILSCILLVFFFANYCICLHKSWYIYIKDKQHTYYYTPFIQLRVWEMNPSCNMNKR